MTDAGQSSDRLDRIERILEQVAANQQVDQQARLALTQQLDRLAANQEQLQHKNFKTLVKTKVPAASPSTCF